MRAAGFDARAQPVRNRDHDAQGWAALNVSGATDLPAGAPSPVGAARVLSGYGQGGPYRSQIPLDPGRSYSLAVWLWSSKTGVLRVNLERARGGTIEVPVEAGVWTLHTRTGVQLASTTPHFTLTVYAPADQAEAGDVVAACGITVTDTDWPVASAPGPIIWPTPL